MKTNNKNIFEIRQIEAWSDPDGLWTWNNSYIIGYMKTSAKDEKRAFTRYLKKQGIVFFKGKTIIDSQNGCDILEIQDRKTKEPLFAAIYKEQ